MITGSLLVIGGELFAFWQATLFSIYGMLTGHLIAFAGVVVFVTEFMHGNIW